MLLTAEHELCSSHCSHSTNCSQFFYCQAEDGGSHGIGIAIASIAIGIGDRLSRQFDLVLAGAGGVGRSRRHKATGVLMSKVLFLLKLFPDILPTTIYTTS